jgi:hydrogenase maturation protease
MHILIAGIGNMFLGDDGFGVAVAQRLISRESKRLPECVQVVDFGIRGIDLAYALLDDYDVLVFVDAFPRGGQPGTLYLVELMGADCNVQSAQADRDKPLSLQVPTGRIVPLNANWCGLENGWEMGSSTGLDTHRMDPMKVLAVARALGAQPIPTVFIGCEPAMSSDDRIDAQMRMGLSEPVQAAVEEAVEMLDALCLQFCMRGI